MTTTTAQTGSVVTTGNDKSPLQDANKLLLFVWFGGHIIIVSEATHHQIPIVDVQFYKHGIRGVLHRVSNTDQ